jgi:exo-beta-1,3-glucanase (GH17 family)
VSYYSFSQTTIEKTTLGWSLLVDGSPLKIKGATFGYDKEVENKEAYFKDLKFLGLHTIRTWATDENTPQLLDAADKYGIKVMLGIWMRHGRPGMEDDESFDYLTDTKGIEAMYTDAIETVEAYKKIPSGTNLGNWK